MRALRLALVAVPVFCAGGRPAGAEPPMAAATLHGVARGCVVRPDGWFQWRPDPEASHGIIGVFEGSTREFENLAFEVGADRGIGTAAQRAMFEATRVRLEVERGQDVAIDLKGETSVARARRFSGVTSYVCAAKAVGRTVIWFRANCEAKREAALVKVLQSAATSAKPPADDVDGWLPAEVKTVWNHAPPSDLLVVDDGKFPEEAREPALKAVRDAHAFVKQSLAASAATSAPAVVRLLGTIDLVVHLAGRNAVVDREATYLPWSGELYLTARDAHVDAAVIARAAARQAVQLVVGSAEAEPLTTGLVCLAEAAALGAPAGSLLPRDEARAYAAVKAKQVRTWARGLKVTGTFVGWGKDDPDARALEAELWAGYLAGSGGPLAKASLSAWVAGMKKTGHPDAASEAAYGPVDATKSDAEFWQYWSQRAEPPKKPGSKPGGK